MPDNPRRRRQRRQRPPLCCLVALVLFPGAAPPALRAAPAEVSEHIAAIAAVGAEGQGNEAAARAWRELVRDGGADAGLALLAAIDARRPLAANWLRTAAEAILDGLVAAGKPLPADALEAFCRDRRHAPRARRFAFEWVARARPAAREAILRDMLDDPSVELRRDAVALAIDDARAAEDAGRAAVALYRAALGHARDLDQITAIDERLRALGDEVDLAHHFGFLRRWHLVGPFDNRDNRGFDGVYPPENVTDLDAEYAGFAGKVRWIAHTSGDRFGSIDLNRQIERKKGVAAYAFTEFEAAAACDVEFRLATVNGWKLWLNGELLFGNNEYHHGTRIDHYAVEGRLEEGTNAILLKVCQNEQTEPYAEPWSFQIRVCDAAGTAVHPISETDEDAAADTRRSS